MKGRAGYGCYDDDPEQFKAIKRRELTECARRAGLEKVDWLLPEESRFFQPLLIGQAPLRPA